MKKVGILRGGAWGNYGNSLQDGADLISYVNENLADKYTTVDIFVDRKGIWHINGLPVLPHDIVHKVDVAWNVSHPSLSQILNNFSIPNISVPAFSSSLKESRAMLREHIANAGVTMPQHFIIPAYQADFDGPVEKFATKKAKEIFEKFGSPWIVKSLTEDVSMGPVRGRESSQRVSTSNGMGVHVANTFPELVNALIDLTAQAGGAEHGGSILVEELIAGREGVMHSLSGFRGEDVYTFPLSNFSEAEKEKLTLLSKNLHTHLGDNHYLKSHFILTPNRGIYITNIDFIPDFGSNSHFCKSCDSVGAKAPDVFEHILNKAFL